MHAHAPGRGRFRRRRATKPKPNASTPSGTNCARAGGSAADESTCMAYNAQRCQQYRKVTMSPLTPHGMNAAWRAREVNHCCTTSGRRRRYKSRAKIGRYIPRLFRTNFPGRLARFSGLRLFLIHTQKPYMSQISTYETLSTPATYLSSDDGMRSSPEAAGRHRGVWKGGLQKHSVKQMLSSKGRGSDGLSSKGSDGPHKVVKKKSNVVKRAIHKIGKKAKRSSPGPPPSAGVDASPPKVGLVCGTCCLL